MKEDEFLTDEEVGTLYKKGTVLEKLCNALMFCDSLELQNSIKNSCKLVVMEICEILNISVVCTNLNDYSFKKPLYGIF